MKARNKARARERARAAKGVAKREVACHGLSRIVEYRAWAGAKRRCFNPNHKSYPDYGGRGISMYLTKPPSLVGQRFGKLVVISQDARRPSSPTAILVKCGPCGSSLRISLKQLLASSSDSECPFSCQNGWRWKEGYNKF
jgi:hypothetical protein